MLNLKHLYYFHCFVKDASTAKTARRLGISSPALSNQLKQLEKFVGVPLSRRVKGRVIVTESGEIVLHYADRMFAAYEDLKSHLSSLHENAKEQLRVGVSHNLGARFTLDLLSLLEKPNFAPAKRVQILFDSSEIILEKFMKGQFDVVLGGFAPDCVKENGWIAQRVIFPVRLFISQNLLKSAKGRAKVATLADPSAILEFANANRIFLVLPASSVLREETDRFLAGLTVQAQRRVECNSPSVIVQLIERGYAMGFASTPSLLDFKTANGLMVLGPPQGYWESGISVLFHAHEGKSVTSDTDLARIFSPASNYKFI